MADQTENNLLIDLQENGTLVLTLNRPDKLNAFDDALSYALQDALKDAERNPAVRCVLLTGAGRGFCAGQDLQARSISNENGSGVAHLGESIRKRYTPIILKLRSMEKPVVCAVNGVAAGAGASIAFACDYRIAAQEASFIQAFIKVGLIPDSGACFMLPRLVGLGRAMDLMMTGRKVGAEEALTIGLVNELCPADDLMSRALAFCSKLAAGPTKAYGLLKRAVNQAMTMDLTEFMAYEADMQEIAGRTSDFVEGVAAFTEKRQARFSGK